MTRFVDASAVVAVIADEPEAEMIASLINSDVRLLWSSVVIWEAIVATARVLVCPPEQARGYVHAFGREWGIALVSIGAEEEASAFEAYRTYGKGSGHPARLNMGDCFAYAYAKTNNAHLLYTGEDFAHTNLA